MITKFFRLMILTMLSSMLLSCGDSSSGGSTEDDFDGKLMVTFNSQGGTLVARQVLDKNVPVVEPENPVKPGCSFTGWYREAGCTSVWNFSSEVIEDDLILYAGWITAAASGLSGFYLVNSPTNPSGRMDVLYNKDYAGTVQYIMSSSDLKITDTAGFTASTAAKTTLAITADTSGNPVYDDYIKLYGLASARTYYFYILDTETNQFRVMSRATKSKATPVSETGTYTGTNGPISYTLSFPAGYDPGSSTTWPLVVSDNGPDYTVSDPNFPCITFDTNIPNTTSAQVKADMGELRKKVQSIVENSYYRIDKNRIYAWGFSIGGCVAVKIANDNSSSRFRYTAIVGNGVSDWLLGLTEWTGNLGNTNIWLSWGETDSYWDAADYAKMPKTGGDHLLTIYPGKGHDASLTWDSPYTFMWLLSK